MTDWHIAYCMQAVHNMLLYRNTDVDTIKPVIGRASTCSASLKTTRSLIALGFHAENVSQCSHSSDPVLVHTICAIHCNIHIALCNISIRRSRCLELYCTTLYCNIATYWYIVTALVGSSTRTIKTHSESSGALLSRWTCETRSAHTFVAHMACLFVIDTERQKFLDRLFDALTSEPPDTWPKTTHKLHIAALCGGFSWIPSESLSVCITMSVCLSVCLSPSRWTKRCSARRLANMIP